MADEDVLDITTDDLMGQTAPAAVTATPTKAKRKPKTLITTDDILRPKKPGPPEPGYVPLPPEQEPLPPVLSKRNAPIAETMERIARPRLRDFTAIPKDVFGNLRPERRVSPELSRRVTKQRERAAAGPVTRYGMPIVEGLATGAQSLARGVRQLIGPSQYAIGPESPTQQAMVAKLREAEAGIERGVAESAEADTSTTADVLRTAGAMAPQIAGMIGTGGVLGPVAGATAFTGLTSDWERDPLGSALQTATAFIPIKAGQTISPLAARAGLGAFARPTLQKLTQLGIEAGTGAAANVGQYAATQGLLNRPITKKDLAIQAVTGGLMGGAFAPGIKEAAAMPVPKIPGLANFRQRMIDLGIVEDLEPGKPPRSPALNMLNMGVDPTYIKKLRDMLPSWEELKYTFPGIFGENLVSPAASKEINAQLKTLETTMSQRLQDIRQEDIWKLNVRLEEIDNRSTPPEGWYVLPFQDEPRYFFASRDPNEKLMYGQRASYASEDRAIKDLNSKEAAEIGREGKNRLESQYRQANRAMQQWMGEQTKFIVERYKNFGRPDVTPLESRVTEDPQGIVTHNTSAARLKELLENATPRATIAREDLEWKTPTGPYDASEEVARDQFGNAFRIVRVTDPTLQAGVPMYDLHISAANGARVDTYDDGPFYTIQEARRAAQLRSEGMIPPPSSLAGSLGRAVQPMPSLGVISPDKAMQSFGAVTLVGTPEMLFREGQTGASTMPTQAAELAFSSDPEIPWIQTATGASGQTYYITDTADGGVALQITMAEGKQLGPFSYKSQQEAEAQATEVEQQRTQTNLKAAIPPPIVHPTDFYTPTVGAGLGYGEKLTPENAPGVMARMRAEGVEQSNKRQRYPASQVFETGYLFTGYAKGAGYRSPEELRAGLVDLGKQGETDVAEADATRRTFNYKRDQVQATIGSLEAQEIRALMERPLESFGYDPQIATTAEAARRTEDLGESLTLEEIDAIFADMEGRSQADRARIIRTLERQKILDKWRDIKDDVPLDIDQLLFVAMQKEQFPTRAQLINDLDKIVGKYPELAKSPELGQSLISLADQALEAFQTSRDLKIAYMEAQPNRLVGLDEYAAALVPSGATEIGGWLEISPSAKNDELARLLGDEGMRVYRYGTEAEKIQIQQALAQFKALVVDPESSYGALYSNPMFDPAAYRRFLGGLFRRGRRPADQPLTEEQQARLDPNDPNYEVDSQRSQSQAEVQDTIDQVMSGVAKSGGREYYAQTHQEFEKSKLARTQARNRLRKLEALRENPEFLDPVRKADLDAAIERAKADRETTLKASQEARKRTGIAEGLVQQEQRRVAAQAAETRLKTLKLSYPVDAERPMYVEEFLGFNLTKPFYNAAQDAMVAAGYKLDPDRTVTSQVVELAADGRIPLDQFDEILQRNGLTMTDFLNQVTATASEAGRMLAKPSHIARQLGKLAKTNPALAKALNERLPTITELNKQYRERANLDRFLSIRSGLLISLLETAQRNLQSAGVVTGLDSIGQLFDSAIQHTFGPERFGNERALSPAVAIRPTLNLLTELARTAANRFDYTQNAGAVSRVVNAVGEAFPKEVKHPLFEILNSDLEEAPGPSGKVTGRQATPEMLAKWRQDAEAMPDSYKRKPKLLAAVDAAQKRYDKTQTLLTSGLIRGERIVHLLNWANRAQETISRRAIFEAKLRRYTQEAGIDLDGLITDGRAADIPVEVVTRAANEALRITFGKRPERGTATDYIRRGLATGPIGAVVKLGLHPFPTFLGNFLKFSYEHSPAGVLSLMSGKERAKLASGDFSMFWKAITGIAVFGMAAQMRKDHYDRQGATLGPDEEPWYVKYPRKPFELTGAYPQAGEKWYEVKIGGRNIDMRFTPFAPAFLAADLSERNRRGLGELSAKDAMEALGAGLRGMDQQADIVNDTIQGIKDAEKAADAGKLSGKYLGAIAAGFLTPLRYISDFAAIWSPEERKRRDVGQGESFTGAFGTQLQERIPIYRQQLPEAEVPTRSAAPQPRYGPVPSGYERFGPIARQITGSTAEEPKNYLEAKLDTLGIKPFEIAPRTGNPKADRIINREMGKFMDGVSEFLAKSPHFNNLPPEQQRADLLEEIFPAFWDAAKGSALAEVPEEMVKAEIIKAFTKEQRNVLDRKRRREGKPTILEEGMRLEKARQIANPAPTRPTLPTLPTINPSPTPFR